MRIQDLENIARLRFANDIDRQLAFMAGAGYVLQRLANITLEKLVEELAEYVREKDDGNRTWKNG